ncbi:DinB family protein [Algoriphagus sp.]|uniref:DinB family protein n=1 Tax=Algoriphagus sp. TaxID=1872435 RepID=UPI00391C0222
MNQVQKLVKEVSAARSRYLELIANVSEFQARWKPNTEVWNIIENTEHLYWAEQGGILGMWKTLHAIREGEMIRTYEFNHKDLTIEEVVEKTWQPLEQVPSVAAPRLGGSLSFWRTSFLNMQNVLEAFAQDLQENELRLQAQHHPISGPLDFHQRLEFLRFHIDRHRGQISQLIATMPVF